MEAFETKKLTLPLALALFALPSVARADNLDTWTQKYVSNGAGIAFWDGRWVTRGSVSTDGAQDRPVSAGAVFIRLDNG